MTTEITVYGFHVDVYGHVNNARYLEFLEAARWDRLQAHTDPQWWHERGYAFVIASITINYRAAAVLGDRLRVGMTLPAIGEHSGTIHQCVHRTTDGTLVADADIRFVILDTGTGRSAAITGELRDALDNVARALNGSDDPDAGPL